MEWVTRTVLRVSRLDATSARVSSQFTELFMAAIESAERSQVPAKRVAKIVETLTYNAYRYVTLGLYARDKLLFVFLVAVKMLTTGGYVDPGDITLFLRGGAAFDPASVRTRPGWMQEDAWLNVCALSERPLYRTILDDISAHNGLWRAWYESNDPVTAEVSRTLLVALSVAGVWLVTACCIVCSCVFLCVPVCSCVCLGVCLCVPLCASCADGSLRLLLCAQFPQTQLLSDPNKIRTQWSRLLLVRCLRPDCTVNAMKVFIRSLEQLGERYTDGGSEGVEAALAEMTQHIPALFLLSVGADPTEAIEQLAKKTKQVRRRRLCWACINVRGSSSHTCASALGVAH